MRIPSIESGLKLMGKKSPEKNAECHLSFVIVYCGEKLSLFLGDLGSRDGPLAHAQ